MPNAKLPLDATICQMYRDGLSIKEIAETFGVHVQTIGRRLKRGGQPRRTPKEAARLCVKRGRSSPARYWSGKKQPKAMVEKRVAKIRGPNHYLWKGGKSRRPYRGKIQKSKCESCGSRINLAIHHIDFDYYNNSEDNLAVLCLSCHLSLHKQAYWDAIKAGKTPPKSTGESHWTPRDWKAWRKENRDYYNAKQRQWRRKEKEEDVKSANG